jgi:hypothetical protein
VLADATDKVEHFRLTLRIECIRRAAEDEPRLVGYCGGRRQVAFGPQERAGDCDGRSIFDTERADVLLHDPGRRHVLFDKRGGRRPATDGFEAKRACPGKEVDGVTARAARADEVEY